MIKIAHAVEADLHDVHTLLGACGLSTCDIFSAGALYWAARSEAGLVGFCGLELADGAALLRSVSVHGEHRRHGLARRLVEAATAEARARSIQRIYLFSKDTGSFFEALGWCEVPVKEVATIMQAAPQVRHYRQIGWYPDERAFRRDLQKDFEPI